MIRDVDDLEERLSAPTEGVLKTMARLEGDLIVLGVAGKMGPTLARMAPGPWTRSAARVG